MSFSENLARIARLFTSGAGYSTAEKLQAQQNLGSIFTKEYVSGELSVAAGASHDLAHGLGVTPKFVQLNLICKTSEGGYTAGEVIIDGAKKDDNGGVCTGAANAVTATSIKIKVSADGTPLIGLNLASGVRQVISPANWRLVVRAYA